MEPYAENCTHLRKIKRKFILGIRLNVLVTVILYVDGGTRGSVICLMDPQKKEDYSKTS